MKLNVRAFSYHAAVESLDLVFDVEDPTIITLIFHHVGEREVEWEVEWEIGREFLASSLHGQGDSGEGDIHIYDSNRENVTLTFYPGYPIASSVSIPRKPLVKFVKDTLKEAPLTEALFEREVDKFIASILG